MVLFIIQYIHQIWIDTLLKQHNDQMLFHNNPFYYNIDLVGMYRILHYIPYYYNGFKEFVILYKQNNKLQWYHNNLFHCNIDPLDMDHHQNHNDHNYNICIHIGIHSYQYNRLKQYYLLRFFIVATSKILHFQNLYVYFWI